MNQYSHGRANTGRNFIAANEFEGATDPKGRDMIKITVATSLAVLLAASSGAFAQTAKEGAPPAAASEKSADPSSKAGGSPKAERQDAPATKSSDAPAKADGGKAASTKDSQKKDGNEKSAEPKATDKADRTKTTEGKDQPKAKEGKEAQKTRDAKDTEKGSAATGAGAGSAAKEPKAENGSKTKVNLTQEQRTEVRTVFSRRRNDAVVNIDITPRVGIAVPRSVNLMAIPGDLVVIVPEYRSYRYFIVGDQVVIVDPDTFMIVEIIKLA